MANLIQKNIRFIYLILLIFLSWAGYKMFIDHFDYGIDENELRQKYESLLQNKDRNAIVKDLKRVYEMAQSFDDKRLYIESYINYFSIRSSHGYKLEANEALFQLLYTHAKYLLDDQLFNIYNIILSSHLEPYHIKNRNDIDVKKHIIQEMTDIFNAEKDKYKKFNYLCIIYSLNIKRTLSELENLEKMILQLSPNPKLALKYINYKKALRCRAKKQHVQELHYMKLASLGGEPNVGELGVSYRNNNMLDSAEVYLLKSYQPDQIDKLRFYFYPSINLAKLYIKKQHYKKAGLFLQQAEVFGKQYLGEFFLSEIFEIKTNLYKEQNLKDLAIQSLEDEKELIIDQYNTIYMTNKSNAFVINEVRSIRNSRNYLLITFFFVIAGIVSFFFLYIFSMLKKYKLSLQEKEMERKKSSELKQELNDAFNKFSELSHISEKKDKVIDSIMSNKDIKKALSHKDILLLNELKSFTNTGNEWSLVKNNFHIHFPEFYSKLLKINPTLTELELRYATYIKMGLSNAEIATLLNINVQSVATFKYRLKYRLNLDKDQSLLEFIINF
jgi:DNA-binding CsgD family transcriptional regulator